jgi:UDP-N-acetylmuramoyl-tripeptide--D-alanyl-D-alanine ligase
MTEPLWRADELMAAARGRADGELPPAITGISIDSRSIGPGELFVALTDMRDGHEFVTAAFAKGAAASLVKDSYQRRDGDGTLIRVADPLQALEAIGRAARARTRAKIVAVTGSVGKTTTKEMLRAALGRCGVVHAAERSFNNHWGVPLTLARMPAACDYGVLEIGMNHAGEISPLSRMVRPDVAVVTTIEPVHLGHFPSVEAIADAKAEIFDGMTAGAIAVLNRDNAYFARLAAAARAKGLEVMACGKHAEAEARLLDYDLADTHSQARVSIGGRTITYSLGAPGRHIVQNSLLALAAVDVIGADVERAAEAFADLAAPKGRGQQLNLIGPRGPVLLIDESYNASPVAVRAALAVLSRVPRTTHPRRIAVLGDMRELGDAADALHAGLAPDVEAADVDRLHAVGPHMLRLHERVSTDRRGAWAATSRELIAPLLADIRPGDVIMVKGSLGTNMAPLVEALVSHFGPAA